jgi:hypothetical protein
MNIKTLVIINIFIISFSFLVCSCESPIKTDNTENDGEFLEIRSQYFVFSPDSNIEITGEQGTIIFIPKNILVNETGTPPSDSIIIEIKEAYTPRDIIFSKLTTQTKDKLLETGGMVFIQATSGNKILKIKENENMKISFSVKGKYKEGMKLFEGAYSDGIILWGDPISELTLPNTSKEDSILTEDGLSKEVIDDKLFLDQYIFYINKFAWFNSDIYNKGGNKTDVLFSQIDELKPTYYILFLSTRQKLI